MKLSLLQADITKLQVDAIVNAANSSLLGGGGVDGAIHRAGGPDILAECRLIRARQGGCPTGEAVITNAGKLPCKKVIHTVGPVWQNGHSGEGGKLAACYDSSLKLAIEHGSKTIAFPNISTGVYRFPKEKAAEIALHTVKKFAETNGDKIEEVIFVCFDEENYAIYKKIINQ